MDDEISSSEPLDVNLTKLHSTLLRLVPLLVDQHDTDAEQSLIRLVLTFDTVYDRFTSWNAQLANSFSVMKHRKCISLLLNVLQATQNCDLAAPVLGTLRCLARVDRNKSYIVDRNGVPIITTWGKSNVSNELVACKSCIALANLVMNSNHEELCVEHGAIELASSCMKLHPNSVPAQTDGASLLCNLAFTSRYTKRIINQGGLTLVTHAMKTFPQQAFLIEECCGCLRNFAGGPEECAASVFRASTIPLVLEALSLHGHIEKLCEEGLHFLRNLSCMPSIRQRVINEHPVVEQMVRSALQHFDRPVIALLVVSSLTAMCQRASSTAMPTIVSQGAIECVLKILLAYVPPRAAPEYLTLLSDTKQQRILTSLRPVVLHLQSTLSPSAAVADPEPDAEDEQVNEADLVPHPVLEILASSCTLFVKLLQSPSLPAARSQFMRGINGVGGLAICLSLISGGYCVAEAQFGPLNALLSLVDGMSASGSLSSSAEFQQAITDGYLNMHGVVLDGHLTRAVYAMADHGRIRLVEFLIRIGAYCNAQYDCRVRPRDLIGRQLDCNNLPDSDVDDSHQTDDTQPASRMSLTQRFESLTSIFAQQQISEVEQLQILFGLQLLGPDFIPEPISSASAAGTSFSTALAAASTELLDAADAVRGCGRPSPSRRSIIDSVRSRRHRQRLHQLHRSMQCDAAEKTSQQLQSLIVEAMPELTDVSNTSLVDLNVMQLVAQYLYYDGPSQSPLDE